MIDLQSWRARVGVWHQRGKSRCIHCGERFFSKYWKKVHLRGHTLYERIFQEDKGEKDEEVQAHAGEIKDNPDITDKVGKVCSNLNIMDCMKVGCKEEINLAEVLYQQGALVGAVKGRGCTMKLWDMRHTGQDFKDINYQHSICPASSVHQAGMFVICSSECRGLENMHAEDLKNMQAKDLKNMHQVKPEEEQELVTSRQPGVKTSSNQQSTSSSKSGPVSSNSSTTNHGDSSCDGGGSGGKRMGAGDGRDNGDKYGRGVFGRVGSMKQTCDFRKVQDMECSDDITSLGDLHSRGKIVGRDITKMELLANVAGLTWPYSSHCGLTICGQHMESILSPKKKRKKTCCLCSKTSNLTELTYERSCYLSTRASSKEARCLTSVVGNSVCRFCRSKMKEEFAVFLHCEFLGEPSIEADKTGYDNVEQCSAATGMQVTDEVDHPVSHEEKGVSDSEMCVTPSPHSDNESNCEQSLKPRHAFVDYIEHNSDDSDDVNSQLSNLSQKLGANTNHTCMDSVSEVEITVEQRKMFEMLKDFMYTISEGKIKVDYQWRTEDVGKKTLQNRAWLLRSMVKVILKVLYKGADERLYGEVINAAFGSSSEEKTDTVLLDTLIKSVRETTSREVKLFLLMELALIKKFRELKEILPDLTIHQYKTAKAKYKETGLTLFPEPGYHNVRRDRRDFDSISHFIQFFCQYVQDVSYGTCEVHLDEGDSVTVQKGVQTVVTEVIIKMYRQHFVEERDQFEKAQGLAFPLKQYSDTLYRKVVKTVPLGNMKRLTGLDYYQAAGSDSFQEIIKSVNVILLPRASVQEVSELKILHDDLKESYRHVKSDIKFEFRESSNVARHCSAHALSEVQTANNPLGDFSTVCDHDHDQYCEPCERLEASLNSYCEIVKKLFPGEGFEDREVRFDSSQHLVNIRVTPEEGSRILRRCFPDSESHWLKPSQVKSQFGGMTRDQTGMDSDEQMAVDIELEARSSLQSCLE